MKDYSLKTFLEADNDEREGKANKFTMKNFEIASRLFEALSVFNKNEKEIEEKSFCFILYIFSNRKICESESSLNNENAKRSLTFKKISRTNIK